MKVVLGTEALRQRWWQGGARNGRIMDRPFFLGVLRWELVLIGAVLRVVVETRG